MNRVHMETTLRIAVTGILYNQDRLRQLLKDNPDAGGDNMTHALYAMEAAVHNLHQYAREAGVTIREQMRT